MFTVGQLIRERRKSESRSFVSFVSVTGRIDLMI
jgi:hypothetical protein